MRRENCGPLKSELSIGGLMFTFDALLNPCGEEMVSWASAGVNGTTTSALPWVEAEEHLRCLDLAPKAGC
jgi:hypothetical protein